MKRFRLALLVAVMTALPAVGFAQSTTSSKTTKTPKPVTATVSGVVKSVSDAAIVITRSNAKGPEESFVLTAATTGKASLKSGDVVSVRYLEANGQKTATVVTVKKAPKKSRK
jgi:hypothetical protein